MESRGKLVWAANQRPAAGADAVMLKWVARGAQGVDANTGAVTMQDALLCMSTLFHVIGVTTRGAFVSCDSYCVLAVVQRLIPVQAWKQARAENKAAMAAASQAQVSDFASWRGQQLSQVSSNSSQQP